MRLEVHPIPDGDRFLLEQRLSHDQHACANYSIRQSRFRKQPPGYDLHD